MYCCHKIIYPSLKTLKAPAWNLGKVKNVTLKFPNPMHLSFNFHLNINSPLSKCIALSFDNVYDHQFFGENIIFFNLCFLIKIFRYSEKIPVNFTTAFYVANVVARYWDQFISLPWPDRLAYKLITYIPGRVSIHYLCIVWFHLRFIGATNSPGCNRVLVSIIFT